MSSNDEENAIRNLLPLVPKEVDYPSDRIGKYKALSDPTDANSVKYDFVINHCEGNEGLREVIRFYVQANKLARACNLTGNGVALDRIITQITHGSAKSSYEAGRNALQTRLYDEAVEAALNALPANATNVTRNAARDAVVRPEFTLEMVQTGLKKIIEDVAPFRALAQVKRYLRRFCRKPGDMKFRQFVNNFTRINVEELPLLPPFGANQSLAQDEVLEIFQYAIPNSWNKEMRRQDESH